jgi:hypothetical protein
MFYTLQIVNPQYDKMELKALQDWFVLNQLKLVPNVFDVNIFGGPTREYQVQIDPESWCRSALPCRRWSRRWRTTTPTPAEGSSRGLEVFLQQHFFHRQSASIRR